MDITDSLICYRRHLKRRNYSAHSSKNYMNMLKHFVLWVDVPLEAVTYEKVLAYIDWLISKRLKPKTINCHVACISGFYTYLQHEKGITLTNPVKKRCRLRLPDAECAEHSRPSAAPGSDRGCGRSAQGGSCSRASSLS